MKLIGSLLYFIAGILFLEVIKIIADKLNLSSSFFLGVVLSAVQFLICIGGGFVLVVRWLLWDYLKGRKRVIILLVGFLFLASVVELIFAYWLYHPATLPVFLRQAYYYYYDQYERNIIQFDHRLSAYHPELFYTLKPLVSDKFSNAEFSTTVNVNSLGLRDDEQSLQEPGIICLGDSYTMGWGVEQSETFPQQLEQKSGIKVLNAAISSYGTARELILLNKLDTAGLKYLCIQYCTNDVGENKNYLECNYNLTVSSMSYFDALVAQQNSAKRYFPGKYFLVIGQIYIKQQINKLYPLFKLEQLENKIENADHATIFLNLLYRSSVNFNKVKVIVTVLDSYSCMKNSFLKEVEELMQQPPYKNYFAGNLMLIDICPVLSDKDFYILDSHLKPSGHRKVAEKLVEIIQKDGQGVVLKENAN